MQRLYILMFILLLGPSGCASVATTAFFTSKGNFHVEKIESYSVIDDRITSVCVTGRIHSQDDRQYSVRIPTDSWSRQCLTESGTEDEPCSYYKPISTVGRGDIKKRCEAATKHQSFEVRNIYIENIGPSIAISKSDNSDTLLYVDYPNRYTKISPFIVPMLPVAIAFDILTSPIQLFFYFAAVASRHGI